MNPNYVHTITLYRNRNGAWDKTVLHNCFWKAETAVMQNETQASRVNTYTARIPLSAIGSSFSAKEGDIVVLGECMDGITQKTPNTATEVLLRNKPNAFKVTAFADNTSHRMDKHYRLGG